MVTTSTQPSGKWFPLGLRLPDPPKRRPDEKNTFRHLARSGNVYLLAEHLGNEETTLVEGELYIAPVPTLDATGLRDPNLLVAFGVDPVAYRRSNGYVISEQGKPPDLVLEIASPKTGRSDVVDKPSDYAALGIGEYWRFDETGEFHGTRLAGDLLVGGRYEPAEIKQLPDGVLQGYSRALGLNLRWEKGQLYFHELVAGRRISTLAEEKERRVAAENEARAAREEALAEREARIQAEARADCEREARFRTEDRNRELEAKLGRPEDG